MALYSQLEAVLKQALLDRDKEKVDILKLVKSKILLKAKTDNIDEPTDEICLQIIRKQIGDLRESIDIYLKQSEDQRLRQAQADLLILNNLLPKQLNEQELRQVIDNFLKTSDLELEFKNFKILIQDLEDKIGNQASRQQIVDILKAKVNSN